MAELHLEHFPDESGRHVALQLLRIVQLQHLDREGDTRDVRLTVCNLLRTTCEANKAYLLQMNTDDGRPAFMVAMHGLLSRLLASDGPQFKQLGLLQWYMRDLCKCTRWSAQKKERRR